ncbi:hypothetical protein PUV54_11915 [Hyphococcus flavus]|uniref:Uncharacterized protein n=1 Tax=Hyphococcus flavus TaxID=1866326 RepID=A0AAE9ZB19_9PROT|nr:hypothetical protein [Hyphococcus flavus]WDI30661.1 hypothetical protein PUV54_11915 [Hyphococcus flavus]
MSLQHELTTALEAFDGKAVTLLSETAAVHSARRGYINALMLLARHQNENVSSGATWLVKDHLDNGGRLTKAQTEKFAVVCSLANGWQAALHLCQSIAMLSFTLDDAEKTAAFVKPLLTHKRPFLRAWSLDALCALADQHNKFNAQAEKALNAASQDPSASVKARARNIAKMRGGK